jgi:hypothetical protein
MKGIQPVCPNTYAMFMWSQRSPGLGVYGEGIYTGYSFTNGASYDVRITFNVEVKGALSSGSNGTINIYAAAGLQPSQEIDCGELIPGVSNEFLLKSYDLQTSALSQVSGQQYPSLTMDDVFTVTIPVNSTDPAGVVSLPQLWIYPQATTQTNSNGTLIPYPYLALTVSSIFVCPHTCNSTLQVINSGTVPTNVNNQTILIGSSDGPNKLGPVTVQSNTNTTVVAGNLIRLDPSFTCSPGSGTASFSINACYSLYNMTAVGPDDYDAQNVANAAITDSIASLNTQAFTPRPLSAGPATLLASDSSSRLRIFPTVSSGAFTIAGSGTDLTNASILVTDESGRAVYKLYNNNGSTTVNLNLGMLGNGLYFVQINNGIKSTTQKIIISK